MKILSTEQIRQWDEYTILNEPISSIDLMERAATQCSHWLIEHGLTLQLVKIFCGKGNNGGDGLTIARRLADKGIFSLVYILENGSTGSENFQINLARLRSAPLHIYFIQQEDSFPVIESNEVIVDCLFGSGLNRPLKGLAVGLVELINDSNAQVISIDIPSGMFADQSSVSQHVIKADHTLTFQTLKLCFLFPENEGFFGEVHVLNIGLHEEFLKNSSTPHELSERGLLKKIYQPRKKFSHKGTYGHTLIVAGEKGKMGAAVLSAKGCLRSGSGLVSCLVPEDEFSIIQTAAPEAMCLSSEEINSIDLSSYTSIAVGPGIGINNKALDIINRIASAYTKPIVADADALNIISQNEGLLNSLPKDSILTPHPKEFERLFGKTVDNFERLKLAKQRAKYFQLYIIVKGAYSMLTCPNGEVYFNNTGNPGMATGGSGDVLTGLLAGLLSQGYSSKHACILGMYLHGLAGDLASQALSQEALIAGDLVEYIGKAFNVITSK